MTDIKEKSSLGDPVFSLSNKIIRVLWAIVYNCLFRFSPTSLFRYRAFILRLFGAKLGKGINIYPSVNIWLPSNLKMSSGSSLAPNVKIYNQGDIAIGCNTIISQGAYLCASTHDYNNPVHPLILAPITIGANVWICADAFIGPNVQVAEGSVVGARSVVMKDTGEWLVYAGNPAIKVNERKRFGTIK
jgi:putative colanic acid biosynthesis acetyltransferase WcaF